MSHPIFLSSLYISGLTYFRYSLKYRVSFFKRKLLTFLHFLSFWGVLQQLMSASASSKFIGIKIIFHLLALIRLIKVINFRLQIRIKEVQIFNQLFWFYFIFDLLSLLFLSRFKIRFFCCNQRILVLYRNLEILVI